MVMTDEVTRRLEKNTRGRKCLRFGRRFPHGHTGSSPRCGQRASRPQNERDKPQKVLKAIISAVIAGVPDVRAWFVNERGERELSFSLLSRDGEALAQGVSKVETAIRNLPGFFNVASKSLSTGPRSASYPISTRLRPRHYAGSDCRNCSRSDHRRCRRQSC